MMVMVITMMTEDNDGDGDCDDDGDGNHNYGEDRWQILTCAVLYPLLLPSYIPAS